MNGYSLTDSGSIYGGMRIIAFVNEKGGVAKTTSCVNLAACFATRGHRVLVMDMDPQSNATLGLGMDPVGLDPHASLLLTDNKFPLERAIRQTDIPRLDLVTSDASLNGCNKALVTEVGREVRLRTKMLDYARSVFTEKYDYVFVDCSPSLDLLTVNVLMAATEMVVPVHAKFYSLQGMALLAETVASLYDQLDPQVKMAGILVTMFDRTTTLDRVILQLLRAKVESQYGDFVFQNVITKNVAVSETEISRKPIVLTDPSAPAARGYEAVAEELLGRLGRTVH
jgi:chromosome partitioning protein